MLNTRCEIRSVLSFRSKFTKILDMITARTIKTLHNWFEHYTKQYVLPADPDTTKNTILKRNHTKRVCRITAEIADSLKLNSSDRRIAEVSALLHDIGRFEQYAIDKVLHFSKGLDHAELGVRILKKHNILNELSKPEQTIVFRSILLHNRIFLPRTSNKHLLLISKLLRDADKLDILNMLIHIYQSGKGPDGEKIAFPYPDKPTISKKVVNDLLAGRTVKNKDLRTLNDFKLYKMGWLLDLNFPASFKLARKMRFLEKLLSTLPPKPEVLAIYNYVKEKAASR